MRSNPWNLVATVKKTKKIEFKWCKVNARIVKLWAFVIILWTSLKQRMENCRPSGTLTRSIVYFNEWFQITKQCTLTCSIGNTVYVSVNTCPPLRVMTVNYAAYIIRDLYVCTIQKIILLCTRLCERLQTLSMQHHWLA